jgi:hypothetical protein
MKFKRPVRGFDSLAEALQFSDLIDRHVDSLDARDPENTWRKNMFRRSPEWREFCRALIQKRGGKCERCGGDDVVLCVHHRDPWHYDLLDEELFAVLCDSCHLKVESMCGTEEGFRICPREDRRFLTVKPYKAKQSDILALQSGGRTARKWVREIKASRAPAEYVNPKKISVGESKQKTEAIKFMRAHPELFI